jgi:hypothetical protein
MILVGVVFAQNSTLQIVDQNITSLLCVKFGLRSIVQILNLSVRESFECRDCGH